MRRSPDNAVTLLPVPSPNQIIRSPIHDDTPNKPFSSQFDPVLRTTSRNAPHSNPQLCASSCCSQRGHRTHRCSKHVRGIYWLRFLEGRRRGSRVGPLPSFARRSRSRRTKLMRSFSLAVTPSPSAKRQTRTTRSGRGRRRSELPCPPLAIC